MYIVLHASFSDSLFLYLLYCRTPSGKQRLAGNAATQQRDESKAAQLERLLAIVDSFHRIPPPTFSPSVENTAEQVSKALWICRLHYRMTPLRALTIKVFMEPLHPPPSSHMANIWVYASFLRGHIGSPYHREEDREASVLCCCWNFCSLPRSPRRTWTWLCSETKRTLIKYTDCMQLVLLFNFVELIKMKAV